MRDCDVFKEFTIIYHVRQETRLLVICLDKTENLKKVYIKLMAN